MDNIIDKINEALTAKFQEEELKDCFLLDVGIHGKKVQVFVDSDPGIKFWQCQKLSRAVEAYLDESQVLGEEYTLEVSSPGVDRPLQEYRQYPRNIGRTLDLTLEDGNVISGKMEALTEEEITLKVQGAKKGQFKTKVIPFEAVTSAIVQVSFKKKKKK